MSLEKGTGVIGCTRSTSKEVRGHQGGGGLWSAGLKMEKL